MATIFLMVLMEKKEPVPETLVNQCTKRNSLQNFKMYPTE